MTDVLAFVLEATKRADADARSFKLHMMHVAGRMAVRLSSPNPICDVQEGDGNDGAE